MLRQAVVVALLLGLPAAASAQAASAGETGRTPQRVRSITLQPNEACPKPEGDEIVVCSRINPQEQYRIPKELRNTAEPAAKNQAWNNRVAVVKDGTIHVQAGAGIVADSDPAYEQRECEAKSGALLAAAREAITRAGDPRLGQ